MTWATFELDENGRAGNFGRLEQQCALMNELGYFF